MGGNRPEERRDERREGEKVCRGVALSGKCRVVHEVDRRLENIFTHSLSSLSLLS